jgi:holo-[acyl-carrier protein] synthase
MVYGIGIDVVKIDRFERSLSRWGERFCQRVFTPRELSSCQTKARPGQHLALRFAAKEAFLKALGVGMFQGVGWKEIEISNEPSGQPHLVLSGEAKKSCQRRGIKEIYVSISHEKDYGVAQVLLEI